MASDYTLSLALCDLSPLPSYQELSNFPLPHGPAAMSCHSSPQQPSWLAVDWTSETMSQVELFLFKSFWSS